MDLHGIEGFLVTVESDVGPGLPGTWCVGVIAGPLKRAVERVELAIQHCGKPVGDTCLAPVAGVLRYQWNQLGALGVLREGNGYTLTTHWLLHGSWPHLLGNCYLLLWMRRREISKKVRGQPFIDPSTWSAHRWNGLHAADDAPMVCTIDSCSPIELASASPQSVGVA